MRTAIVRDTANLLGLDEAAGDRRRRRARCDRVHTPAGRDANDLEVGMTRLAEDPSCLAGYQNFLVLKPRVRAP